MDLNRRSFIGSAVCIAATGVIGEAAGNSAIMNRRTYVAACPPVKTSIPRTPGPQRVMVIGAHPDDADITCGCTVAKLIAKGARVKFVAVTNGSVGHHLHGRAKTAAIRRQETIKAAKVWGLTVTLECVSVCIGRRPGRMIIDDRTN